jgi:hypothetical protein
MPRTHWAHFGAFLFFILIRRKMASRKGSEFPPEPYYANYVVQNTVQNRTPSYETLYKRTTSRLQEDHICIINTKEPYFHQEFAMYGRITRITWYNVDILGPYYAYCVLLYAYNNTHELVSFLRVVESRAPSSTHVSCTRI